MKKVLQWIGIFLGAAAGYVPTIFGLPLLMGLLFVAGLEQEWEAMNDDAESALRKIGLNAYAKYAPWEDLNIGGTLTAFVMPKYDNHVDNTNLWAGVMALAAAHHNHWQVESVTAGEYASLLKTHLPEAAFLHPAADLMFDAKYVNLTGSDPAELAFFDQDTGLMIYLCTYGQQLRAGSITADKLSVPHNGFVYEMETHGGFHGDGDTFYALIVPEEKRTAFEATLSAQADWHNTTISYGDYLVMHDRKFFEVPLLYPAEGTDFEWWSFVDTYARQYPDKEERAGSNDYFPVAMQEIGARWSMNWLVALYDADTGLFIYYEYDS